MSITGCERDIINILEKITSNFKLDYNFVISSNFTKTLDIFYNKLYKYNPGVYFKKETIYKPDIEGATVLIPVNTDYESEELTNFINYIKKLHNSEIDISKCIHKTISEKYYGKDVGDIVLILFNIPFRINIILYIVKKSGEYNLNTDYIDNIGLCIEKMLKTMHCLNNEIDLKNTILKTIVLPTEYFFQYINRYEDLADKLDYNFNK